jgi:hypothetical protein
MGIASDDATLHRRPDIIVSIGCVLVVGAPARADCRSGSAVSGSQQTKHGRFAPKRSDAHAAAAAASDPTPACTISMSGGSSHAARASSKMRV